MKDTILTILGSGALAAIITYALTFIVNSKIGAKYTEVKQLFETVVKAFEDDKISTDEYKAIVAQCKAVFKATTEGEK